MRFLDASGDRRGRIHRPFGVAHEAHRAESLSPAEAILLDGADSDAMRSGIRLSLFFLFQGTYGESNIRRGYQPLED